MIEKLMKRDQLIVIACLVLVTGLSWVYILSGAGMDMGSMSTSMDGMKLMTPNTNWSVSYIILMLIMWWVMMVAMMLPSAAPMIMLFSTVNKKSKKPSSTAVPTLIFVSGYLLIWGAFSATAVSLQWLLTSTRLLDQMMQSTSLLFSGGLLIVAGLYQFTPVKQACLKHCQSPLQFVMTNWIPGKLGALKMGLKHGVYCLGCCWFLMCLLFFGGVMNIVWIGGLALYVLLEKFSTNVVYLGKVAGGFLVVWGTWLIGSAII